VNPITHIEFTIRGSPAHHAIAIAGDDTGDGVHFPENRGEKDHGRFTLEPWMEKRLVVTVAVAVEASRV